MNEKIICLIAASVPHSKTMGPLKGLPLIKRNGQYCGTLNWLKNAQKQPTVQ